MSHINGKEINFAYLINYGLDKLTTRLDQQMFLMNHMNAIILSQSLKL
jgi:hypothetical protein